MATTHPARLSGHTHLSKPVRLLDRYFYFVMSLLVAVVVVYGFSHTINDNLLHPTVPRPLILTFHAVAFSTWVIFFIFQSLLVRTRNVRIHRLTGWFGASLGAAMVVLGFATTVVMGRFNWHTLHEADAVPFILIPFNDMAAFAVTLALAIYWRRKPEFHRRLILIATCVLTAAGFGRFPINFPPPLYFYYGVDLLIFLGVVRDLIVNHRVHKVYLYALPALIVCQSVVAYIVFHNLPFWVRIARGILS